MADGCRHSWSWAAYRRAEKQRRYYEANKAEIAEKKRRYREARKRGEIRQAWTDGLDAAAVGTLSEAIAEGFSVADAREIALDDMAQRSSEAAL